MALNKIKNNTFHRIGDRYEDYFNANHFMGRSSMDDFGKVKPKGKLKKVSSKQANAAIDSKSSEK